MKVAALIVLSLVIFLPKSAIGAACCSGGGSAPSIISGDDRFHFRGAIDGGFVVGEVKDNGKAEFYEDETNEVVTGIIASSIYRFTNTWQAGVKLPIRRRDINGRSSQDLGDLKLNIAFEPFPIYRYSSWRPKLFIFGAMTFPTGTSTYETQNVRLESFSRGFYAPSLGFYATKAWRRLDLSVSGEWTYQFERTFDTDRLDPGSIYSARVGAGYRFNSFRIGMNLGPTYEEAKVFRRAGIKGPEKLVWDTSFEASYDYSERISLSLGYLDQSLLGPAKNVTMTRSFSAAFLYRLPV